MIKYYFVAIIFVLNLYAKEEKFYTMNKKKIDTFISQNYKIPNLKDRIKKSSYMFLNTPYKIDPLGEGIEKPLYSFKGVDCVTFVESVLSISNSENFENFKDKLQLIRYKDGKIDYNNRNHIMISQWIPNNIKNGVLKNITNELIKNIKEIKIIRVTKKITKKSYGRKFKKFLKIPNIPMGEYNVDYISIDDFINFYKKIDIPDGTIMTIVRKNLLDYPIMISHLGFIIKKDKIYYFRNATKTTHYQKVKDAKLMPYLRFYNKYYAKKKWHIVGLQFFSPKEF